MGHAFFSRTDNDWRNGFLLSTGSKCNGRDIFDKCTLGYIAGGKTTGRGLLDFSEDVAESFAAVIKGLNPNGEIGNFYEEPIDESRLNYIVTGIQYYGSK